MEGADDNISDLARFGEVRLKLFEIGLVGPGQNVGRNAWPVERRYLTLHLVHRDLIGRMPANDGDSGGILCRFVVGRPIDRASLQEGDPATVALDDGGSPRGDRIGPSAGVQDARPVEMRDRFLDRSLAIIDVVCEADSVNASLFQGAFRHLGIGEKSLDAGRPLVGAICQAALKV